MTLGRNVLPLAVAGILLLGCETPGTPHGVLVSSAPTEPTATALPSCDRFIGSAFRFDELGEACLDTDGTPRIGFMFQSYGCVDGRVLAWTDEGWGYADEADGLRPHAPPDGQRYPPQRVVDACTGLGDQ